MGGPREDINDVLDDVIVKINRITDHLRGAGENEAANQFTRDMTATFQSLMNVIAPWDLEQCLMHSCSQQKLMSAKTEPPPRSFSTTPSNTWASVAATEPVADKHGIIKFRPSDAVKRTIEPQEKQEHRHDARDRRVVWVSPWSEMRPLSDISNEMREVGAIYSIAYAPEAQAVCIIFQHAYCAVQFMHNCAEYIGRHGISPFGSEHDVSPGLPYQVNDGLRRMDPPHNERRRLTFARSQLFSNGISEARFRKDIEDIVGPSNIERLWLFNTGNATVVFSAVPLAKMVRETFLKNSRTKRHAYEGVMVSFSHDPCERDLHLVSQIPGHANYIGGNGSDNGNGYSRTRSNTISTDYSNASSRRMSANSSDFQTALKRRNTGSMKPPVDEDGWQTVKKRR
ncbi:hypothetical protein PMZ80_002874 [Knufia obscura]|uniref:Uncharacterized protein n=2 Tax=Knufia TaxID=430999 RepID=A0AAN8I712_9EURO|nr:hypothetical protein PMZ80_002874 [Knufia obscura]KAK5952536.1 hypothetical protein OHC33_006581 [Knufia fluminis]